MTRDDKELNSRGTLPANVATVNTQELSGVLVQFENYAEGVP